MLNGGDAIQPWWRGSRARRKALPRGSQEAGPVSGPQSQLVGQELGQLARRAPFSRLDLLDRYRRASDQPGKLGLSQVRGFAAPPERVAKRQSVIHRHLRAGSR
jgi:hypothetical protein